MRSELSHPGKCTEVIAETDSNYRRRRKAGEAKGEVGGSPARGCSRGRRFRKRLPRVLAKNCHSVSAAPLRLLLGRRIGRAIGVVGTLLVICLPSGERRFGFLFLRSTRHILTTAVARLSHSV